MALAEGKVMVNKQRQASNGKLAAAIFWGVLWGKTRKARKIRKLLPTLNSRYASILA